MGVKSGSHTTCTLGAIILVIEIARNGRQQFIIRCFILNRIILDVMVLIAQLSRIGCNLLIQSREVRSCGIFRLDIGTICCRTNFCIHRAAGYQLLRAICFRIIRIRFRGISNLACTDCFTPRILAGLLCCFSPCFYSITITRVFNGVVVFIKLYVSIFIRLIDFDLTAHIRSILQLFHDNSIMVFNAVSCFNKAVVVGGRIPAVLRGFISFIMTK